ncbi:MAG: hypothetical protein AAFR79_15245 [Pseudomonadota bacterium]
MDPTSAAGIGLVIAKLGAFALLVYASQRATKAAREAREARAAAEAQRQTAPEPLREAA